MATRKEASSPRLTLGDRSNFIPPPKANPILLNALQDDCIWRIRQVEVGAGIGIHRRRPGKKIRRIDGLIAIILTIINRIDSEVVPFDKKSLFNEWHINTEVSGSTVGIMTVAAAEFAELKITPQGKIAGTNVVTNKAMVAEIKLFGEKIPLVQIPEVPYGT